MKLDRQPGGRGKYGLIKNRVMHAYLINGTIDIKDRAKVIEAIVTLQNAGIIEWGEMGSPEEFFVVKLKDVNAYEALSGYAHAAAKYDPEYAHEVMLMAMRAAQHPDQKVPD